MTSKRQVIFRESARQKKDNTPEWRRVNWARFHTMTPILDALENQNTPEDIQNALRNYLVISLVSTIEYYFKSIAIKNIDKWNMNISDIVNKDITIPFSAFDQIKAGDTTKGTQIARSFNFAKLDDIDDFFSKYDIRSARYTIEKEQNVELPKLLNDPNEITRHAASELYQTYMKLPEKLKRAGPNYWK